MNGITTYPFNIFAGGWEKVTPTVVRDVEHYAIYGGNPAKFIKKRFSDEQIEIQEEYHYVLLYSSL